MASLFKRNNVWYVGFTVDGQRVERSTGESIKSKALVRAVEIEAQYRGGDPACPTVQEALQSFLRDLQRQGKSTSYQKLIQRYLQEMLDLEVPLNKVQTRDLTEKLAQTQGAPGTVNKKLSHLITFFRWCEGQGILDKNPAAKIRKGSNDKVRPKRAFNSREWEQFTQTVGRISPQRLRTYRVMVLSGLRPGEVALLSTEDFTLGETSFWHLRPQITKTRRRDRIPMLPECRALLEQPGPPGRILLPTRRGTFDCDLARAGLDKADPQGKSLSPHSLRYTFALNLILKGTPIQVVKKLMRHRTITLTADLYADLGLDDLMEQTFKIPFLGL